MKKYTFPIITKISINHFSLYKKSEFIDIEIDKDVFCLAGANGLGKSTFITILNYALTGIVKNPTSDFSSFKSIDGFYSKSLSFAKDFFDGRISEDDMDISEVKVTFKIGAHEYTICRGFFDPEELRFFRKVSKGVENTFSEDITDRDRNVLYQKEFAKDVGLTDFAQYVFLQLYVFTFDETHQLLFWNDTAMERVLHLFFGVDPIKAQKADQLRKVWNKYDSNARNIQYQISNTRNDLKIVQKSLQPSAAGEEEDTSIQEIHRNLIEKGDKLMEELQEVAANIKETNLIISDLSLQSSNLRSQYTTVFNQTLTEQTPIQNDPEILLLLNELKTKIFTEQDYKITLDRLVVYIKSLKPSGEDPVGDDNQFVVLEAIDHKLREISDLIRQNQHKKDRYIDSEQTKTNELNMLKIEIDQIESDNQKLINSIISGQESGINAVVKNLESQIERLGQNKEEAYRKRNEARDLLKPLEDELSNGYFTAEEKFIPSFNQFASSFLGLMTQIQLTIGSKATKLSLNISDATRSKAYQLSESQRYFVDIALRMALIDLSTESATLLIDTPEGSLDIAYESRAGQMFADFAKKPNRIIMTANINSSQLLLELAEKCRDRGMKIERMTNWTLLSEVQEQEHEKIEKAYTTIENKLRNG